MVASRRAGPLPPVPTSLLSAHPEGMGTRQESGAEPGPERLFTCSDIDRFCDLLITSLA